MASGIFALLDDIALLMDDVALASKVATKKTAGILGDDLAVNAEKATGFLASRELPVLWKITKGSLLNKLIIIPLVFFLQVTYPPSIDALLIIGGFYLAYEGIEKIVEWIFHKKEKHSATEVIAESEVDDATAEKTKVKSAIITDFILSLEIVIIALGTVLDKELSVQIATVSVVALIATVGVYGLVALIVRMDDAGYNLIKFSKSKGPLNTLGILLVRGLPIIIRILSVVGTFALIMVAGGIFSHYIHDLPAWMNSLPGLVRDIILGTLGGILAVLIITPIKYLVKKVMGKKK